MTIELSKLGERFENSSGYIQNIVEGGEQCGGVSLIFCEAGSSRSHHKHREDSHTLVVIYGEMKYIQKRDGEPQEQRVIHAGQGVFTGPGLAHSTYFEVDTMLLSVSARSRTKAEHEADLVRVEPLVWREDD
jgi:quercetin dioxygenase-like cupin family protein